MNSEKIRNILLTKWQSGELAHFYLLQASPQILEPKKHLKNWIKEFLKQVIIRDKSLGQEKASSVLDLGHPDILFISPDENQSTYGVNDPGFREFIKFASFRPFELKNRFAIVEDAHLISPILSNKLLKILEEPTEDTIIFFLQPTGKALLPTIESRAISILLPPENMNLKPEQFSSIEDAIETMLKENGSDEESQSFLLNLKNYFEENKELYTLLEHFKGPKERRQSHLESLLRIAHSAKGDYEPKVEFLDQLKWFYEAQTFNNMPTERFYGLIHALKHLYSGQNH